jgi:hypothetical protein
MRCLRYLRDGVRPSQSCPCPTWFNGGVLLEATWFTGADLIQARNAGFGAALFGVPKGQRHTSPGHRPISVNLVALHVDAAACYP